MLAKRTILGEARSIIFTAVVCFFLLSAHSALSQVDEGAVTGVVQDPTGAVIPNAVVTLLNTDQGLTLTAKTSDSGSYTFSPVRIGHYTVTASAPGFSATTQQNLTVAVGQNLQVNISLKTGASNETVTITAAPPELQTDESSVGQVVDEKTINDLPLNGRNFTFLAQLSAGVNVSQADTRGNAASGAFTANGLQSAQNNYLLDGIDNNSNAADFLNGTNYIILPPVDAIQEFKVQTADFSAELGRSAGAVLNATIKSGTNHIHGAVWEFFRNDKLDAADWFEDNAGIKKGEFRQNQFGASIGGPILKNKAFFFGDYEGLRRVQGTVQTGTVPSVAEVNSGYTDLSGLLNTAKTRTDDVGRLIPYGTVLDPATTRAVTAGVLDQTSGRVATASGFVRDPIYDPSKSFCPATSASFVGCNLNQIPSARLDATAVGLLKLYPLPQSGTTFTSSPSSYEHRNAFDTRVDFNPTQKDQAFVRISFVDDPDLIPGIFGGVADGGGFQQGLQTARSEQGVLAYTHVFTPTTINVARVGYNHLHTTRFGPDGGTSGIPAKYGIQGIPQQAENGGLPQISISGLTTLGSNDFLPSDEVSQTLQIADDFTKIYGKNTFKVGFEYQAVHFNTLQPAYSRGEFDFTGNFEGVPNQSGDNLGLAQILITPTAAMNGGTVSYVGGANQVQASNIAKTYDLRHYAAGYFQDDLKVSPKLTLNIGLRYDFFTPISETNGAQANFVQSGPPNGTPTYLVSASGKADRSVLTATPPSPFVQLLATDGIALDLTDKYGKGLGLAQKVNFGPRFGFAYEVSNKLVARGGVGMFFNAFENAGYGPNVGRNYPFAFSFDYGNGITDSQPFDTVATAYNPANCPAAAPTGGSASIGVGLSCSNFNPALVNPENLGLQGIQFNFKTPNTISSNVSLQYAITPNISATGAYVYTHASHLQVGIGDNEPSQLLAPGTSLTGDLTKPVSAANPSYIPFRDFGENGSYQSTLGASIYNGLQMKLEARSYHGLSALFTYTYSKTLTNSFDLLNGGSLSGFRAPYVPGLGPRFDWGPASFDIRNVFHISGGYELPIGKGKQFMGNASKLTDEAIGGWSLNFLSTLEGGQPITLTCPQSTAQGVGCNDVRVAGQSQKLGIHTAPDPNGSGGIRPFWFGNAAAFNQPCELNALGQPTSTPTGCTPISGAGALGYNSGTTVGPGFHRLDLSLFKQFPINERFRMEFRSEFFNILNHPNFNAPNFGGNGVVAIGNSGNFTDPHFGEIGSTRDAPNDPRQIQFALKLYY